jgi:CDGSH-type Zn-finger protein
LVSGNLPLQREIITADKDGEVCCWKKGKQYPDQESYGLCRCGKSKTMPYCDSSHLLEAFDGTETASRKKYSEQIDSKTKGPQLELTDVHDLCANGRFCDRKEGTWNLTKNSGDLAAKKMAIQQACDCPAGRLVAWDKKTGKAIEPAFEESLAIVDDPSAKCSGPIWVKGGVQIQAADGFEYEKRNRVTLCRCGRSANKPFCDGTHSRIGFDDGEQ